MNWNGVGAMGILLISGMIAVTLICLLVMAVSAETAGSVTLGQFRGASQEQQTAFVVGAMAMTDLIGVVCQKPATAAEYVAALRHRELDPAHPWVEFLVTLMDERGCIVPQPKGEKPNA